MLVSWFILPNRLGVQVFLKKFIVQLLNTLCNIVVESYFSFIWVSKGRSSFKNFIDVFLFFMLANTFKVDDNPTCLRSRWQLEAYLNQQADILEK